MGIAALILVLFVIVLPFTPMAGKIKRGLKEIFGSDAPPAEPPVLVTPAVVEPEPEPVEPDPGPPVPRGPIYLNVPKGTDVRKLAQKIDLKVDVHTETGGVASQVRKANDSYLVEYTVKAKLPKPAKTMDELLAVNPELEAMLPGLPAMLEKAAVSPWFEKLYMNKAARLRRDATQLGELLTRHNLYDCETMLNLRHPESGRRVFLMQAEMDVVSDGSDGDRLPVMPEKVVNSTYYQPFTTYGWRKTGTTPNPMIKGWEQRIENAKSELAKAETPAARKTWLRGRIKTLREGVADMKNRSFLVAEYDPFIVIPVNILVDRKDSHAPNKGDYVIVIYGKKAYPAIVGDGGPDFKVGEGSLRFARELNARAGIYSRPVSDLTVTYLVFPRSADDAAVPDYGRWRKRCEALVKEIGGLGEGVELHEWADLFPKLEEEAVTPPSDSGNSE